jgi:hypothetical protein
MDTSSYDGLLGHGYIPFQAGFGLMQALIGENIS